MTGGPTIQTITRTSQGNPATSSSQPKVVTPSAGGIVVTQLPPGLTLRPGGLSVTSQGKVVSGAHAGGQAGAALTNHHAVLWRPHWHQHLTSTE